MKIKLIVIDSFDAPQEKSVKYFYDGEHITDFIYSPEECGKQIISHFE